MYFYPLLTKTVGILSYSIYLIGYYKIFFDLSVKKSLSMCCNTELKITFYPFDLYAGFQFWTKY